MKECVVDRFLPTTQKVCHICAHPVQSWIALVDKNNGGQVWNWKTGEIIYAAQFGGVDESAMHYHSLQKMAEIDPAYWGAKVSQQQSVSKTPTGKLKMIHFLDVEVLYWQRIYQLSMVKGRGIEVAEKTVPGAVSLQKERWLLIVCENKILFYELITHSSRELSKTALDAKNPVCISILPNNSQAEELDDVLLAIGCTDGTIRVVSFSTLKTIVRLGYKSSPITCMMSLYVSPTSTLVVSGAQEGSIYAWDPFPTVAGSANASLPPVNTSAKVHDSEVLSLSFGYGTLVSATPAIFSLGADRSVLILEVPGFRILSKIKGPNPRVLFHSLDVAQPLEASPERCPVLLAAQGMVWGSNLSGSNFYKLLDPSAILPSDSKKPQKIYYICLHPLNKHWMFLGTNSGAALVRLPVQFLSQTVSLPLPRSPTPFFELTCIKLSGTTLSKIEYMAVSQDTKDTNSSRSVAEIVMESAIGDVAGKLGVGEHRQLVLSPCTSKLAVVQTLTNQFVLYTNTGGATWNEGMEGKASLLVWNSTSEYIAVLDTPPASPTSFSARQLSRARSRVDSSHSQASETHPISHLKIYKMGNSEPIDVPLDVGSPSNLHGGPMLGITCLGLSATSVQPFVFYSWEYQVQCSDELPSPNWLSWNETNDLCAMSYPTHVLLCQVSCRVTDRFQVLNTVPIDGGISGIWRGNVFYISTHDSVECIIVQKSSDALDADRILSIQVVVLAGFDYGLNWLTGYAESTGRTQKARPIGHLKVLNATQDKVWLIDTHDQAAVIDINYPGFLALAHGTDQNFQAARIAAMGKLPSDFLGQIFLLNGKKASVEALKLPGLSLTLRLRVAIEANYLKHAMLCFQAILAGCNRPEAVVRLPEFRETLKEENPTPKKAPPTGPSASPFSQIIDSLPTTTSNILTAKETINWNSALPAVAKKPPKKLTVEVSRDVLKLGLELYDAAVKERMYSVSDTVAALLIEHCKEESDGDILLQLESRFSERGHKDKLKLMADLSEKSKKSNFGQLKGLTAAVLSGDPLVITQVLQDLRMS